MSTSKLIQKFSTETVVPIDIQEQVIPAIQELGFSGEIYWWYSDVHVGHLRGFVEEWSYPASENGPSVYVFDITVSKHQGVDWQRLVACKELIHMMDPEHSKVDTDEKYKELTERISLPEFVQDGYDEGIEVLNDRLAVFQALAILFPLAARNQLLPKLQEKKITIADIARVVDLPPMYVATVMSDFWPRIHESIIKL